MASLTQKASKATFWNLGSGAINGFLRFTATAIVARVLEPKDFGVFGIAMLVQGIVLLFGNFGFGHALIYKKNADEEHFSTFFWTNLITGFVLMCITIGLSPVAAFFFRNEQVQPVLMVISINFLINGVSTIYRTRISKELRFKEISITEFFSTLIHISMLICAAYMGFGVWSIVWAMICSNIIRLPFYLFFERWYPHFIFNTKKLKEMFGYGKNIFAEQILNYLAQNLDYFIVGRILGAKELGLYKFAYSVPHLPYVHFSQRVSPILFPMLSKVQNDPEKFRQGYLKTISFVNMITFPVISLLFVTADEFVLTIYGNQWEPIIIPLKILCITAAVRCVETFSGSVFNSRGRPDIGLKFNTVKFPIVLTGLIIGAHYYGVIGLAVTMSVFAVISFIISTLLVVRFLKIISYRDILNELKPGIIPSFFFIVAIFLFQMTLIHSMSYPLQLVIKAVISSIIYIGSGWLFFKDKWIDFFRFIKHIKT